jgi:hypothetical protein
MPRFPSSPRRWRCWISQRPMSAYTRTSNFESRSDAPVPSTIVMSPADEANSERAALSLCVSKIPDRERVHSTEDRIVRQVWFCQLVDLIRGKVPICREHLSMWAQLREKRMTQFIDENSGIAFDTNQSGSSCEAGSDPLCDRTPPLNAIAILRCHLEIWGFVVHLAFGALRTTCLPQ